MSELTVENLYNVLDESTLVIQNKLEMSYLEALVETGLNIFENKVLQEELDADTVVRLKNLYDSCSLDGAEQETVRKGIQLALLKGMKKGIQPHHAMTPDSVAHLIGYLVKKYKEVLNLDNMKILDPAVGTGNLLTSVLNQLDGENVEAYGVEPDDLLLHLGFVNANLQKHQVEFLHQDSVKPLYIPQVNTVVTDLPVGYYPHEEAAAKYELKAEEGMSYVHHLLIEQSLNMTEDSGMLFFMIPNFLFGDDGAKQVRNLLNDRSVIHGIIQLPTSLFANESQAKSILVAQKKGEHTLKPKQVMMAKLPSFSNREAMLNMMQQINGWFSQLS
ncbi:class I SAM-dependent methyltransferase [Bacillus sp. N1-1]|jgi:site-specific DNA-methyltransferase (adenine-specific)|uniref:class I SAM-dependent methyltransferase n=1 Tax=Bacillus sp. N1-1 TaxID=2682541 RepID=UPI0013167E0C|nr:class I SAM-dependent methyltransferase [Bacillus sp. N1-1]QHA92884.1 N-6 DNA methylase [Bacillus sp. N1-1]